MVHLIKSEMVLNRNGIQFETTGKLTKIQYGMMVWIYVRKQTSSGDYRFYDLDGITENVTGELIIIDSNKDNYVFLENCLHDTAGRMLAGILDFDDSCLAGYSRLYEQMYQEDFSRMVNARRMMAEASIQY